MQIFKKDVEVTLELKVLRLLSNVSCPISLTAIVVINGLTINILFKMKKDGLILMNDNFIEITEKGKTEYNVLLDESY